MQEKFKEIIKIILITVMSILVMYLGLFVASTVFIGIIVIMIGFHMFIQIRDMKYVSRNYFKELSFRNPVVVILLDLILIIAVINFSPIFKKILFALFTIGLLTNLIKVIHKKTISY